MKKKSRVAHIARESIKYPRFDHVILEKEKGIATLTLNSPETMNALDGPMFYDMIEASRLAAYDTEVRVLILTGAGRAFSSGGDIKWFNETVQLQKERLLKPEEQMARGFYLRGIERNPFFMFETMPKPVIAMANGDAVGAGCNMMLHCDIAIASETARFCYGYTRIGLHSGGAGSFAWARKVGIKTACELCFTARFINGIEAKEYGLVNKVVPPDQLKTVTYELAKEIAAGPPMALAMIKRGLYSGMVNTLEVQDLYDSLCHYISFMSDEHKEGVEALIEKRKPQFDDMVPLHPYITGILTKKEG
jgi:2-(1,2-epoxy-1,2-dihydrophenyl)acetyl-CoA isomerase